jgi:AraC-like DNA-binding protein
MSASSKPAKASLHWHFALNEQSGSSRLGVWHEVDGRILLDIGIEPVAGTSFHANADILPLGTCAVSTVSSSRARYYVAKDHLKEIQDTTIIICVRSGRLHARHRGQEAIIGPGQAVAVLGNEVGSIELLEGGDYLNIYVQTAAIAAQVPDLHNVLMRPMEGNPNALQLLTSYAAALQTIAGPMGPDLANSVSAHLIDLAARVLGTFGESTRSAEGGGIRASRRQAIKDDIAAHLTEHELSPDDVARRVGIKPRYMRELLQDDGTSFSDLLRYMRLQAAYQLLTDPKQLKRSISTIAYHVGFSDLSHFNRCFRRQFGATPSDIREQQTPKL